MSLRASLQLLFSLPPREVWARGFHLARRSSARIFQRHRDRRRCTYTAPANLRLRRYLPPLPLERLHRLRETFAARADRILHHRFHLLGADVEAHHGAVCPGREGHHYEPAHTVHLDRAGEWLTYHLPPAAVPVALELWRRLSPGYVPIDWQRDYLSGHRWQERTWAGDCPVGHLPGVDVKIPWELGRLQHLPVLACAHALAPAEALVREFQDQVLDFQASNPPAFGVQWRSPMDVGIRVANLLVAHDLFRAHGASFAADFERAFLRSIYEHGRFLTEHLEWHPSLRGNHYLANIVGLLYAAAYLDSTPEVDAWLRFAAAELHAEFARQFLDDGGNFEASTSYHLLSAGMIAWGFALLTALPPERRYAPRLDRQRLARVAAFTEAIVRPDGRIGQIGDNDSGFFLDPIGTGDALALAAALHALAEGTTDGSPLFPVLGGEEIRTAANPQAGFTDFGLYIYRRPRWWLAVRCGPNGQNGHGGHAHNDQLSFELVVDGVPLLVDPGSYLYTPAPQWRNHFRSTAMHNTLAVAGREQNAWAPGLAGLFQLADQARPRVLEASADRFVAEHVGFGAPHQRTLLFADTRIEGHDSCAAPGERTLHFHLDPAVEVQADGATLTLQSRGVRLLLWNDAGPWDVRAAWHSPSYGVKEPTRECVLTLRAAEVRWRIELA